MRHSRRAEPYSIPGFLVEHLTGEAGIRRRQLANHSGHMLSHWISSLSPKLVLDHPTNHKRPARSSHVFINHKHFPASEECHQNSGDNVRMHKNPGVICLCDSLPITFFAFNTHLPKPKKAFSSQASSQRDVSETGNRVSTVKLNFQKTPSCRFCGHQPNSAEQKATIRIPFPKSNQDRNKTPIKPELLFPFITASLNFIPTFSNIGRA
jgi:hypothetical protein